MPKVQGLSKAEANYRKAENPKFSCHECAFMLPRLSIGGCRFVRGVIHAEDTRDELPPKTRATSSSRRAGQAGPPETLMASSCPMISTASVPCTHDQPRSSVRPII